MPEVVGFQNYADLFSNPGFLNALFVTFRYTLQVLPPLVILALLLAILANKPFGPFDDVG